MDSKATSRSISRTSTALDLEADPGLESLTSPQTNMSETHQPTLPPPTLSKEFTDRELHDAVGGRFLVEMEGSDDPRNPQNWRVGKKIYLTALMTAATMFAGMSSAVLEGSSGPVQAHFQVGEVASIFASSIFVIGFACGPLVFGPLSELMGRKDPLILGCFLSSMFQILCAVPPNFASLLVGRFLAGVFGSAPYAIGGGFFHDVFDAIHVQAGVRCFAVATAGGPAWGPVIGAGLSSTSEGYGWRWASWCMVCFGMTVTVLLAPLFEETYVPAILARQAKAKRDQTGDWAWHSAVDRVKITPRDIVVRYLLRPLRMLFTEPMLLVISIYMSFVYALLYMLMAALPIIYHEIRGYSPVVSSLPLVSVFIGILFGGGIIILDMYRYARVCQLRPEAAVPEQRFFPMGLGAFLLPIGLFWFAFTGPAQVTSPWPSIIALALSMCGMVLIFECGIIYIIDMYKSFANSAIAANTIMRSLVGGAFPLFTPAMVRNLGYSSTWSMVLLACIAVVLAPIPVVFYRLGSGLRAKSRFSAEL